VPARRAFDTQRRQVVVELCHIEGVSHVIAMTNGDERM
jgi:hypothetical protein